MQDRFFYKQETMQDFGPQPRLPEVMPKKIGPYPVDSLLNQGKISLLYLGTHPETKYPLAIKVLAQSSLTHPELIDHFLKEARIIAMANHPNIVKLYGEGKWDKGLYIAMEFIQGVSLRQFIKQRSLTFQRSLEIALQTAFALLHLHTHGVIHRDMKPENILIQEDGQVKVIDFGIAQLLEEQAATATGVGRLIGTPSYMSPEQKENPVNACFASDIYALGVIAYELIAGKLSYGVIDLAALPKGLRPIIEKSLAAELKNRYQDIVDFIHDLNQYIKLGEWEKDHLGRGEQKELDQQTHSAQKLLLPQEIPKWPQLSMSLAKHSGIAARGLYCDFFQLPNNTFLFFLAHSHTHGVASLIHIASLHGMIRALVRKQEVSLQKPMHIVSLVAELNHLLLEEKMKEPCSLQILLLNPLMEELHYLSCGGSTLLHVPSETHEPRYLHAENPWLGKQEHTSYIETIDNWMVGDLLLIHSLDPFASLQAPEEEKVFLSILSKHIFHFPLPIKANPF